MLGHGSTLLRPNRLLDQVKTHSDQSPRTSQTSEMEGSETKDLDSRPPRLMSETSETHVSEASKTLESKTSEFEALVSETLEFRDQGFEFITCDVILSIQVKCQALGNKESNTLSDGIWNSNAITTKSYLDLLRSKDG
jgi:hypothetical protein